jgi:hypothetical protein
MLRVATVLAILGQAQAQGAPPSAVPGVCASYWPGRLPSCDSANPPIIGRDFPVWWGTWRPDTGWTASWVHFFYMGPVCPTCEPLQINGITFWWEPIAVVRVRYSRNSEWLGPDWCTTLTIPDNPKLIGTEWGMGAVSLAFAPTGTFVSVDRWWGRFIIGGNP